jgi:hypothetical protein
MNYKNLIFDVNFAKNETGPINLIVTKTQTDVHSVNTTLYYI